jgi:hypothetical protein
MNLFSAAVSPEGLPTFQRLATLRLNGVWLILNLIERIKADADPVAFVYIKSNL